MKLKKDLPDSCGVYVLFLTCVSERNVKVGRFGVLKTKPGVYAYVGSAYGAGGIASRVGRHMKTAKKCRWHIDYIRRYMKFLSVWVTAEEREAEHDIARRFIEHGASVPMPGFGSSDCGCLSHLFHLERVPQPFYPDMEIF